MIIKFKTNIRNLKILYPIEYLYLKIKIIFFINNG